VRQPTRTHRKLENSKIDVVGRVGTPECIEITKLTWWVCYTPEHIENSKINTVGCVEQPFRVENREINAVGCTEQPYHAENAK